MPLSTGYRKASHFSQEKSVAAIYIEDARFDAKPSCLCTERDGGKEERL